MKNEKSIHETTIPTFIKIGQHNCAIKTRAFTSSLRGFFSGVAVTKIK
jgi:hypothetical protein